MGRPVGGFASGYMPARDHRDTEDLFRRSVVIWIREDEEDSDERMQISDDYGDGQCVGFWPAGDGRSFGSFANVFPALWSQKDRKTSGAYPLWDRTLEPDERYRLLEEEDGDDRLPLSPDVYTPTSASGTDGNKDATAELKVATSWGRRVPEGQSGIIIPGTAERVQASVFMPTWDGVLVTQWNGDESPEYSTRVTDIDERKHDENNVAGLHSFWKVEVLPDGETANGVNHELRSALAWSLTGHTADPVGFGLVVGAGVEEEDADSVKTGSRDTEGEEGSKSPPMIRAFMSSEQGGPLHVGGADDQHVIFPAFSTPDGREHGALNAGHLSTSAIFFASPDYDAPLGFETRPEPKVSPTTGAPFRTNLTLKLDEPHAWGNGNQGIGLWMWHTRVPVFVPPRLPPRDPGPGGGGGLTTPRIPGGDGFRGGGSGGRQFFSPSTPGVIPGGTHGGSPGGRLVDPRGGRVIPGGRTGRPPGLGPLKPVEGTERVYPGTSEDLAKRAKKRKEEREAREKRKKEEREARRRRKREERKRREEERKRRAKEEKERRKRERTPKPQVLPPRPGADPVDPDDDDVVIVYGPNGEPHLIKKKSLEKLKGPPRLYTPLQEPVQVIGTPVDWAVPALTFKANVFCPGDEKDDLRYNTGAWTEEQLAKWNRRPAVLRVEAYGHETCANDHFDNEDTGQRYADMPTVAGGLVILPASVGMEDRGSSFAPDGRTVSEGHVTLLKDKVFLAFAEPDITSGGVKSGFRMGTEESGGDLVVYAVDSDGVDTERVAVTEEGLLAFAGRTSSSPALKRSSTELQARLADDSVYTGVRAEYFEGEGESRQVRLKDTDTGYTIRLSSDSPTADRDLLVPDEDGTLATQAAAEVFAATAVSTHESAGDPHPGYALEAELGSMAAQDNDSVNIDGGTIDGTVITLETSLTPGLAQPHWNATLLTLVWGDS